jgi:hypothetical protein
MTPLHETAPETPLSPPPKSALRRGSFHAVFFVTAVDTQSRPRAAIDTGSPLPITR